MIPIHWVTREEIEERYPSRKREIMKAYSVTFTNCKGPGRSHSATYRTAVVIAESPMEAAGIAEEYRVKRLPKLFLEEIRLDDDLVIQRPNSSRS